ncbi:MAG: endolytic transglycosylase MltG [Patescibacteria group bacterium]
MIHRKLFITAVGTLLAIIFLAIEIYAPHTFFEGTKPITIPSDSGARAIGSILKTEGAIRSRWVFVLYAALTGQASALKPGRYVFSSRDTIPAIARAIAEGRAVYVEVVIPEGWTAEDIASRLFRLDVLTKDIFLSFVSTPPGGFAARFDFLGSGASAPRQSLEGYLFPDTYRFSAGGEAEAVADAFLKNFGAKLTPALRAAAENRGRTIRDIVIMASILEREVVSNDDRAVVSGILWKRLKAGMPLQVDATISYILKIEAGAGQRPDGKLTTDDLAIDSPYNTYKFAGLPSGPIGNPGISAIAAAIDPRETPYLYYLSRPDGVTVFSRTLKEHNAAKARYLR